MLDVIGVVADLLYYCFLPLHFAFAKIEAPHRSYQRIARIACLLCGASLLSRLFFESSLLWYLAAIGYSLAIYTVFAADWHKVKNKLRAQKKNG